MPASTTAADVELDWIDAELVPDLLATDRLRGLDAIVIPGGFGERGIEGMVAAAGYARDHGIPCLGLCLGLQVMVISVARDWAGLERANSRRVRQPHPAPGDRPHARPGRGDRQGRDHAARLVPGRAAARLQGGRGLRHPRGDRAPPAPLRVQQPLQGQARGGRAWSARAARPTGAWSSSSSCADHPYWVATQAHPEFKSRPDRAHPLFRELVAAALERAEGREPHLLDLDAVT